MRFEFDEELPMDPGKIPSVRAKVAMLSFVNDWPPPGCIHLFPGQANEYSPPRMLEFLIRVCVDTGNILHYGDDIVPHVRVPFTSDDLMQMQVALMTLDRLRRENYVTDILLSSFQTLSPTLVKIEDFYVRKVGLLKQKQHKTNIERRAEELRTTFLLSQGERGMLQLYHVDRVRERDGLMHDNGTFNFTAYKGALAHLKEARKMYLGFNSNMMPKSPELRDIVVQNELIAQTIKRNEAIKEGINDCLYSLHAQMEYGDIKFTQLDAAPAPRA